MCISLWHLMQITNERKRWGARRKVSRSLSDTQEAREDGDGQGSDRQEDDGRGEERHGGQKTKNENQAIKPRRRKRAGRGDWALYAHSSIDSLDSILQPTCELSPTSKPGSGEKRDPGLHKPNRQSPCLWFADPRKTPIWGASSPSSSPFLVILLDPAWRTNQALPDTVRVAGCQAHQGGGLQRTKLPLPSLRRKREMQTSSLAVSAMP